MILLDETNPVNRAEYARYRWNSVDQFAAQIDIEAAKFSLTLDVSNSVDISKLPPEYKLGMFLGNSYHLESRDQWWNRVNDASEPTQVIAVRRAMYLDRPVETDPQFVPWMGKMSEVLT